MLEDEEILENGATGLFITKENRKIFLYIF
jgi:hypothetical protein